MMPGLPSSEPTFFSDKIQPLSARLIQETDEHLRWGLFEWELLQVFGWGSLSGHLYFLRRPVELVNRSRRNPALIGRARPVAGFDDKASGPVALATRRPIRGGNRRTQKRSTTSGVNVHS